MRTPGHSGAGCCSTTTIRSSFPKKRAHASTGRPRTDPQNARVLQEMLRAFRPTHAIVWGFANWDSIVQSTTWAKVGHIPGLETSEPCRTMSVNGHTTLFTCILHPSSPEFTFERWAPVLS